MSRLSTVPRAAAVVGACLLLAVSISTAIRTRRAALRPHQGGGQEFKLLSTPPAEEH